MTNSTHRNQGKAGTTPPATTPHAILDVRNLTKVYGEGLQAVTAIGDISFTLESSEFVCIVGPSGAGKTTLLNCLTGLIPATSGGSYFEGMPVTGPPAGMAVVFQDYGRSLFPWLTVARNVSFPLKGKGIAAAEITERVEDALNAVGLKGTARKYPWQLSGGMQQRVAIARALAYKPDCLIMDEPFASVDAQTRFELEDLLLQVRNDYGISVLFVTHDIDEAVYLSDRVVVLTRSPATVRAVVPVDLSRPRDQAATRGDPRFAELRTELFELVQTQHEAD
ncbi:ABC transporter ATP-binding protein [Okibacterium endophyticum]